MAEPARKQRKPMSEQARKRKRALDRERSRTRVNIGQAFSEWRELKEKEGCKADADLAFLLMRLVEPAGVRWLTPGLRKYSCQLTIDTNTVNRKLKLSEDNRKVTLEGFQSYPDHPDKFDLHQLLCRDDLTGRCYWEVEWRGKVYISVSYRRIRRRGKGIDSLFGANDQSWSLSCSDDDGYAVWHNNRVTSISSSSVSNRVAVYVDCPAGILSFYRVSSDSLIHLHTFNTTFTEPLLPGFGFWPGSSVFLC